MLKRPMPKLKLTPKASVPNLFGKRQSVIKKQKPVRALSNQKIQTCVAYCQQIHSCNLNAIL